MNSWFLWAFAAAFALSIILEIPNYLVALDPTRIRYRYVDEREKSKYAKQEQANRELRDRFQALGFVPLGFLIEKLPLWGKTVGAYTLASSEHRCFVTIPSFAGPILRLLSLTGQDKMVLYSFYTPFTNGAMVYTSTNPGMKDKESDNYVFQRLEGTLEQVLAEHEIKVREFEARGWSAFPTYSAEARLEAVKLFYASPGAREMLGRGELSNLAINSALLILLVLFASGILSLG